MEEEGWERTSDSSRVYWPSIQRCSSDAMLQGCGRLRLPRDRHRRLPSSWSTKAVLSNVGVMSSFSKVTTLYACAVQRDGLPRAHSLKLLCVPVDVSLQSWMSPLPCIAVAVLRHVSMQLAKPPGHPFPEQRTTR